MVTCDFDIQNGVQRGFVITMESVCVFRIVVCVILIQETEVATDMVFNLNIDKFNREVRFSTISVFCLYVINAAPRNYITGKVVSSGTARSTVFGSDDGVFFIVVKRSDVEDGCLFQTVPRIRFISYSKHIV